VYKLIAQTRKRVSDCRATEVNSVISTAKGEKKVARN